MCAATIRGGGAHGTFPSASQRTTQARRSRRCGTRRGPSGQPPCRTTCRRSLRPDAFRPWTARASAAHVGPTSCAMGSACRDDAPSCPARSSAAGRPLTACRRQRYREPLRPCVPGSLGAAASLVLAALHCPRRARSTRALRTCLPALSRRCAAIRC